MRQALIRYYGWYSNVLRGKRRKRADDDIVPCLIDSDRAPAAYRKSWASLIKKIYEVDPLLCPKCKGPMRIISFIEDQDGAQREPDFGVTSVNYAFAELLSMAKVPT